MSDTTQDDSVHPSVRNLLNEYRSKLDPRRSYGLPMWWKFRDDLRCVVGDYAGEDEDHEAFKLGCELYIREVGV